jgi:hypothetical protein
VTVQKLGLCWGVNGGTLGNGKTGNLTRPGGLAKDIDFKAISVGGDFFSCGVATNGRAWCRGRNTSGNLGDGSTVLRSVPVLVDAP